jgi:IS5 family transposase
MQNEQFKENEIMYTKENEHQYSFKNDWFMVPEVDKNHELIKMSDAINWESLSEKLAQFYCSDNGRPTKPSRAKIGLLVLKHLNGLSDKNVVDLLKRDLYAQYLCDVSLKEAQKFINPSTLTYFRKQIGQQGVKLIEDEVLSILKKNKVVRGRRLVTDTTVMPVNIAYPTDINLIDKVRRKAVEYLDKAKNLGAKTYRTYQRTARRVAITYQKVRKHTLKMRRKTQKKLLQFSKRNIEQLSDAVKTVKNTKMTKDKEQFINKTKKFLETAQNILTQQSQIYQNKKVTERIVSVHKTHIRPMVRGKFPIEVEFGPKILVNLQDDCLFLEDLQFNNVSDSQLLDKSIENYKERFDKLPTQLAADRGFWSKSNYQLAENYGIKKIAIENKGKSNYLKGKPFRERLRRLRCKIEAKISLAKRKYGLNLCRYSIENGEEIWARLGLLAMNLKMAFAYG